MPEEPLKLPMVYRRECARHLSLSFFGLAYAAAPEPIRVAPSAPNPSLRRETIVLMLPPLQMVATRHVWERSVRHSTAQHCAAGVAEIGDRSR
jgi:hypothetical protein